MSAIQGKQNENFKALDCAGKFSILCNPQETTTQGEREGEVNILTTLSPFKLTIQPWKIEETMWTDRIINNNYQYLPEYKQNTLAQLNYSFTVLQEYSLLALGSTYSFPSCNS